MRTVDSDSSMFRAKEHLEMARQLRRRASRLKTDEARSKLTRLASLYEQLSLCYLDDTGRVDRPPQYAIAAGDALLARH